MRHEARLVKAQLLDTPASARGRSPCGGSPWRLGGLLRQGGGDGSAAAARRGSASASCLPPARAGVGAPNSTRIIQCAVNLLVNAATSRRPGGDDGLALEPGGDTVRRPCPPTPGSGSSPKCCTASGEVFAGGSVSLDRSRGGLGLGPCGHGEVARRTARRWRRRGRPRKAPARRRVRLLAPASPPAGAAAGAAAGGEPPARLPARGGGRRLVVEESNPPARENSLRVAGGRRGSACGAGLRRGACGRTQRRGCDPKRHRPAPDGFGLADPVLRSRNCRTPAPSL